MTQKTKIAIMGWVLNSLLVIGLGVFMYQVYPQNTGYTKEQRAEMNKLISDNSDMMNHISVADIGLDAELFMDEVR